MNRLGHLLCFILFIHSSWSQNKDSIAVTNYLNEAIVAPKSSSFYLKKVDSILSLNEGKSEFFATLLSLKVKYYLRKGQIDEAKKCLIKGQTKHSNSKLTEALYLNLTGSVNALEKNFKEAILSYKKSLVLYDSLGMEKEAAYVKNNIANIFFNLNDFKSAYKYVKESFEVVYRIKDTTYYPQIASILAIAEAKLNKIGKAKIHATLAINDGIRFNNLVAQILGNYAMGDVYVAQKKWNKSYQSYNECVALSQASGLLLYESFGRIGLLLSCNELHRFDEAIKHGEKAVFINNQLGYHFSDYKLNYELSVSYEAISDYENAFLHLKKANEIYRSYNTKENNRIIQNLLTKYQTEKKEKALKKKELALSKALLGILLLLVLLSIAVAVIFWIKKRNQQKFFKFQVASVRKEVEAYVEGERIERERIAADFHDGISSSLTGLALQLKNDKLSLSNEQVFHQIESIRNEVRAISKNIVPFNLKKEGWNYAINHFISTIKNDNFQIHFIPAYSGELLNSERGMVLYRIVQELIQNTIKHANATECELLIEEEKDTIILHYSDNGKGVIEEVLANGNGWQSILKRLEAIQGAVVFPSNPLNGFKVDIHLLKQKT